MTAGRYRKKPVVIDAIQFTGENFDDVFGWVGQWHQEDDGPGMWQISRKGLNISTLEGEMRADPEDWIIRGVKGEFYPCKSEIFDATYEPVEDGS